MKRIESIVVDHLEWLQHIASQLCRDIEDAKDLKADTIEKILMNQSRFDFSKDFKPWASTVMRNIYINKYNQSKAFPLIPLDNVSDIVSYCRTDSDLVLSQMLSIIDDCSAKSVAIECVMLYVEGYDYKKISLMLGIPYGTVMSRISNGRKMLRKALSGFM